MPSSRDLHHDIEVQHAIPPQSLGATAGGGKVSRIINRAGFDSVEFVFHYGAVTATGATVGVSIKDGDTTGALSAVTGSLLLGSLASAGLPIQAAARTSGVGKNCSTKLGYIGLRQYVEVTMAPTVSGGIIAGADVLLGSPRSAPVTAGNQ